MAQTETQTQSYPNHVGQPLDPKWDLFAPPPGEIGPVTSASSTLKAGSEPWAMGPRLAIIGAAGFAGTAALYYFEAGQVWSLVVGGVAALIAWFATSFGGAASYVGKDGAALISCSGARDKQTARVLRFANAEELKTGETRRYKNGIYQGTSFSFAWFDAGGKELLRHDGTYHDKEGNPGGDDLVHFGRAAERAWTRHLIDRHEAAVRAGHAIEFKIGRNALRIAPGRIEVDWGGKQAVCEASDIAHVSIEQGWFTIQRKDAKVGWFSSDGVFKFQYSDVPNAHVFLLAVENIAGVKIS